LGLTESAIIAGSLKAPARYNPLSDSDAGLQRAQLVLRAMRDAGFIDEKYPRLGASHAAAHYPRHGTPGSGWFADWVMAHLGEFVDTSSRAGDCRDQLRSGDPGLGRAGRGAGWRRKAIKSMPAKPRWWR
jgi:hypothetical protein